MRMTVATIVLLLVMSFDVDAGAGGWVENNNDVEEESAEHFPWWALSDDAEDDDGIKQ